MDTRVPLGRRTQHAVLLSPCVPDTLPLPPHALFLNCAATAHASEWPRDRPRLRDERPQNGAPGGSRGAPICCIASSQITRSHEINGPISRHSTWQVYLGAAHPALACVRIHRSDMLVLAEKTV